MGRLSQCFLNDPHDMHVWEYAAHLLWEIAEGCCDSHVKVYYRSRYVAN